MSEVYDLAAGMAIEYLKSLPDRPAGPFASAETMMELLGGPLQDGPTEPSAVLRILDQAVAAGGLVPSSGPRYFGFVVGGTLPVALAADWLVTAWDQNAGVFELGPAVATAEHVAGRWLVELFGLPPETSVGFPTGCQMGHMTALAAARHHVLGEVGWDVERDGLIGAPAVNVIVGEQRHLTVDVALRYLGFGTGRTHVIPADGQGRMLLEPLRAVLREVTGPTIVCVQAGDVHSGAVDPIAEVCEMARAKGAWVHVDGAFGLWAAAVPRLRPLVAGIELADSWASDAHKWLNVPYDCGLVFVAHPQAHRAAMLESRAEYLPPSVPGERDNIEWVPELSRRARSVPVWAALRALGRDGVADLVERCCALARRFGDGLATMPGAEVLNDVVLNQVMVRFGDSDEITRQVISELQQGGVCWFGGTTWAGRAAMRISVSSWRTTEADVDTSLQAISAALQRTLSGA